MIAEGVETIAHGSVLLPLGCECAHGYGIARPMPAQLIMQWVQDWRPDVRWQQTLSTVESSKRNFIPHSVQGKSQ